jgi:hypothetical protein
MAKAGRRQGKTACSAGYRAVLPGRHVGPSDPAECRESILNVTAASERYRFKGWQPAAAILAA